MEQPHHPVYISWDDANAYCSWGNRRLPTEAEWEKTASWDPVISEKYIYPWGNDFDCKNGNFDDQTQDDKPLVPGGPNCDGFVRTSPVGSFPAGASPYGALDIAGNVWEWVADWYDGSYYWNSPSSNPLGPDSGQYRVMRGGSFTSSDLKFLFSANRSWDGPSFGIGPTGFRCALSATHAFLKVCR